MSETCDDSAFLLIAEDRKDLAEAIARTVRRLGGPPTLFAYDFIEGESCLSRERRATGQRVCAAILDVSLPCGSGLDLVPIARQVMRNMPILVLTGHVEPEHANAAQRLGVEFAFKPVGDEAIRAFLDRAQNDISTERSLASRIERFVAGAGFSAPLAEIVRLAMAGLGRKEIAAARGVTVNTVKGQIREILERVGLPSLESVCERIRGADR